MGPVREDISVVVDSGHAGLRLDKFLARTLQIPLRRIRRRLDQEGVLVNGIKRPKGYSLQAGERVCLPSEFTNHTSMCPPTGVELVARSEHFAAVGKPAGVHSQSLRGKEPGVDSCLQDLFPDMNPILLNRLDRDTSGLLAVGLSPDATVLWHEWQERCEIKKLYLARIQGAIEKERVVRNRINSAKRRKVRVLREEDPSELRWTHILPLRLESEQTTLCLVRIFKGCRHQIRAHTASIGHPVLGDGLYGPKEGPFLFLHHFRFESPEFSAEIRPLWLKKEDRIEKILIGEAPERNHPR